MIDLTNDRVPYIPLVNEKGNIKVSERNKLRKRVAATLAAELGKWEKYMHVDKDGNIYLALAQDTTTGKLIWAAVDFTITMNEPQDVEIAGLRSVNCEKEVPQKLF